MKSYPWHDEPSGNSRERARVRRMRLRSTSSAGMVRSLNIPFERQIADQPENTMMIVKYGGKKDWQLLPTKLPTPRQVSHTRKPPPPRKEKTAAPPRTLLPLPPLPSL